MQIIIVCVWLGGMRRDSGLLMPSVVFGVSVLQVIEVVDSSQKQAAAGTAAEVAQEGIFSLNLRLGNTRNSIAYGD